ncbi:type VI secretion system-associated protein TagF [Luteibacter aegosomatis]|uniref:type VI secretion system-associated protein TagF n=1 Tax=Luteibacter aegosomatis TaxID=2911537 RepID=UPI001FFBE232|nr:type VI secretion system-associated protein TagF [Luteibacter aegosomatis]UPG84788.1 type VI secretion system-associated protein TagF [Luteibacter aegosomatis]
MRTPVAGWYGKLPAAGDFVQRRLPAAFVEPWDAACRESLIANASRLGDAWPEAFLAMRPLRFVIAAGPCGEASWVGVVGPSRDRVGRVFPLTVAAPLSHGVTDEVWFAAAEVALHLAVAGASVHEVDDAVASLPVPRVAGAPSLPTASGNDASALFWHDADPFRGLAVAGLSEGLRHLCRSEDIA